MIAALLRGRACLGIALQWVHQRIGGHERLAAQAGHAKLAENGGKVPDELK